MSSRSAVVSPHFSHSMRPAPVQEADEGRSRAQSDAVPSIKRGDAPCRFLQPAHRALPTRIGPIRVAKRLDDTTFGALPYRQSRETLARSAPGLPFGGRLRHRAAQPYVAIRFSPPAVAFARRKSNADHMECENCGLKPKKEPDGPGHRRNGNGTGDPKQDEPGKPLTERPMAGRHHQ
jgi:hypothetical protein